MRIINIPVAIFILILVILVINGYEVHSVLYAPSIFLGFGRQGVSEGKMNYGEKSNSENESKS